MVLDFGGAGPGVTLLGVLSRVGHEPEDVFTRSRVGSTGRDLHAGFVGWGFLGGFLTHMVLGFVGVHGGNVEVTFFGCTFLRR